MIEGAFRYDVKLWARSLGRERAFRRELMALAHLAPGESVLDLGCGTGTQAIVAKQSVGATGAVHGIDPSAEMIDRARRKARRAGVVVEFETGVAQALPFADSTFDAALATLTLHHLGDEALHQAVGELKRMLRPGGRVLAVDLDLSHLTTRGVAPRACAPDRGAPRSGRHRVPVEPHGIRSRGERTRCVSPGAV